MTKPNCYSCKHRQISIAGGGHSSCHKVGEPILAMAVMLKENVNPLGIVAKQHGVLNGWFTWPIDFDPVWLEACRGFEKK